MGVQFVYNYYYLNFSLKDNDEILCKYSILCQLRFRAFHQVIVFMFEYCAKCLIFFHELDSIMEEQR